jgi:hypothetical protein
MYMYMSSLGWKSYTSLAIRASGRAGHRPREGLVFFCMKLMSNLDIIAARKKIYIYETLLLPFC